MLLALLGPIWAFIFGRNAFRQKDVLERILWVGLAMMGVMVAAPIWIVAVWMVLGGPALFPGMGIDISVSSRFGLAYLAGIGMLAMIVGARRILGRLQRRS